MTGSGAGYEPIIVTTLRRYMRRGASLRLLHRLAGGARDWQWLNRTWDIEGASFSAAWRRDRPRLALDGDGLGRLGCAEWRIALRQVLDECDESCLQCPAPVDLAAYLGCSYREVLNELQRMSSTVPARGRNRVAARAVRGLA